MRRKSYHAFHDPNDPVRINEVILEAMDDGLSHKDVLQVVSRKFPRAQTTMHSIRFYASKRRRDARESVIAPRGLIPEAILAGFADPEIVELVRLERPTARTSIDSVRMIRYRLRRLNPEIPTSHEALRLRGLA